MPSCLFVALPLLLLSSHVLAAPPIGKEAHEGTLRMEVGAEVRGTRPIHIGPGVSTTLLFDTDIQQDQVSLEPRAHFARVSTGSSILVLVPSNDLQQGETLTLSVPFKDVGSTLPSRLSLRLVVDSSAVDRQVEIYRRARSAASLREEVQQLRAELERLRQERASLAGEGRGEQTGFRGLLMATTEYPGVLAASPQQHWNCRQPCSLLIKKSASYSSGSRRAVQLWVTTVDKKPWTVGHAVLVDRKGKEWVSLPPAQSGPITAESGATLVVEFDVSNGDLEGYQLKISDVDGARTAQWSGIQFP
ncbi:DUF2381 family protein [Corallococcus aberystwythensis]|uniref:DUF2381 family protein n=1 Tax=Corallococcus aberystwythensis TaxID=2316722 RepID=UPI0013155B40|nr:DUF2381 family protein [Corallococcus aberystwythensis]